MRRTRRRKSQKHRTFRNSGTPVCRTERRKSQKMHFQVFWNSVRRTKRRKSQQLDFQDFCDSCAQNKTSEISNSGLSGILGLPCAEQDVGNLKHCVFWNSGIPLRRTERQKSQKMHFQEFRDSRAQNKTLKISKIALSRIMGLLCAEQDVGNFKKCTYKNSRTPVRKTRRRKSQKMHV